MSSCPQEDDYDLWLAIFLSNTLHPYRSVRDDTTKPTYAPPTAKKMEPTQKFVIFPITSNASEDILMNIIKLIKTTVVNFPPDEATTIIKKNIKELYNVTVCYARSSRSKMIFYIHKCGEERGRCEPPIDLNICVKVINADSLLSLSLTRIRRSLKSKEDIKSLPLPQVSKELLYRYWLLWKERIKPSLIMALGDLELNLIDWMKSRQFPTLRKPTLSHELFVPVMFAHMVINFWIINTGSWKPFQHQNYLVQNINFFMYLRRWLTRLATLSTTLSFYDPLS